jgi:hypothetical protein
MTQTKPSSSTNEYLRSKLFKIALNGLGHPVSKSAGNIMGK